MKKVILVGLLTVFVTSGTAWAEFWALAKTGEETITVTRNEANGFVCELKNKHVPLDCENEACGKGDKLEWVVINRTDKKIQIIVMNLLRVDDPKWYVDPLVGPGGAATHRVQVEAGETKTLKTKVRKKDGEAFGGLYDYEIGIKDWKGDPPEGWNPWEKCADPQVHIRN